MAKETFTIKRRPAWDFLGEIKVEIECDPAALQPIKLGLAIRAAVKSEAHLSGAHLSGADLSGADLSGAHLSGAHLSGAHLSGAHLSGAHLSGADLSGADLSGADLSEAHLSGANIPAEGLRQFKADMWLTLTQSKPIEVQYLIARLRAGDVDGSTYGDGKRCACLVGTLARAEGTGGESRDHGSGRPAERWFMMIKPGDVPGTVGEDGKETGGGYAARLALEWAVEWCQAVGVDPEPAPVASDAPVKAARRKKAA